jgi:hypothetical protein
MRENPWPLYDALSTMALSVLASCEGPTRESETAWLEASMAAPEAFPPGPLADGLNLALRAVGDMATGVTA